MSYMSRLVALMTCDINDKEVDTQEESFQELMDNIRKVDDMTDEELDEFLADPEETDEDKAENEYATLEHEAKAAECDDAVKPVDKKNTSASNAGSDKSAAKSESKESKEVVKTKEVSQKANMTQPEQMPVQQQIMSQPIQNVPPIISGMVKPENDDKVTANFSKMHEESKDEFESRKHVVYWESMNGEFLNAVFAQNPGFDKVWMTMPDTQKALCIQNWMIQQSQMYSNQRIQGFMNVMNAPTDDSLPVPQHHPDNCSCGQHHDQPHPINNLTPADGREVNPLPGAAINVGTFNEREQKVTPSVITPKVADKVPQDAQLQPDVVVSNNVINGYDGKNPEHDSLLTKNKILQQIKQTCNSIGEQICYAPINHPDGTFSGLVSANVLNPMGQFDPNKSFTVDLGNLYDQRLKFMPVCYQPGANIEAYPAYRLCKDQKSGGIKDEYDPENIKNYMLGGNEAITSHPMYDDKWRTLNSFVDLSTIPTNKFRGDKDAKKKARRDTREKLTEILNKGVFEAAIKAVPGTRFKFDPDSFESGKSFVLTNVDQPSFINGPCVGNDHPMKIVVNADGSIDLQSRKDGLKFTASGVSNIEPAK